MKKIIFAIGIAAAALSFSSCQQETTLTPNELYVQDGGNVVLPDSTNSGGGTGGSGGGTGGSGLPTDLKASTTASNRAALLEDFTGVRCGFCPDGHVRAKAAQQALGADKFVIVAVHGGSYAAPAAGWANFTTPFGAALISQADVAGYPAGTVNRLPAASLGVTAQRSGSVMSRGSWETAGRAVNAMESPVNIGATATIDASMNLTVDVDLYYTADETATNNINVALLQDGLISRQSGGNPSNAYEQNHVLRDLITGQWGDVVLETTDSNSFVRKSYNYTVPADYNGTSVEGGGAVVVNDLKVVVFVSRGNSDILNAIEIDVQ